MKEILIVGDHDLGVFTSIPPDFSVERRTKPDIHDVDTIGAERYKKPR
jgi:hypothetical protein